ncbi:hypothetical protein CHS0354_014075 [Potamilus streckersoni]|uniref:Uncharacterized protein n=2 Tax=Potamilus streckersoni TaxID=2493646 RepID=A0AAE0W4L7_9BIVA|nr:hypothetical protein CHS0354_014075 [Potamilus streckersoni]
MASNKIVSVALDFGTTYSGYAFSFRHDKENIITSRWTGKDYTSIKAPTSILFTAEKKFDSFGFEAEDNYAELSKNGTHKDWYLFKNFKLVLINEKKLSRDTQIRDFGGKKMAAMDVFSEGIRFLKDDFSKICSKQFLVFDDSYVQWVLTVPAIWDDAAKQFMRLAAKKAGIPDESLLLVLEPDAAALEASVSRMCEEGEKCMILDCGGGTVDVSIMKKTSKGRVDCIYRPTGGVWGGTKVDDSFQEFLIENFGVDNFKRMERHEILDVLRSFESAKKKAHRSEEIQFKIRLPLTLREDIHLLPIKECVRRDKLILSFDQVIKFFEKPVNSIVAHLQEVIEEPEMYGLKYIIMVGGFSESVILQSAVQNSFPKLCVLVAEDPGAAVLKGAVHVGHDPKIIESRRSAYTYGIESMTNFIEKYHNPMKMKIIDGKKKCSDTFIKFIEINEVIQINQTTVTKSFHPAHFGQTSVRLSVYRSTLGNPLYVTDPGCEKIGGLAVQMPDLTGEKERVVEVSISFGETELRVEAADKTTGRKYTAAFDFLGD